MKVYRWACDSCGAKGIEFNKQAAEDMLAVHSCLPPPVLPPPFLTSPGAS